MTVRKLFPFPSELTYSDYQLTSGQKLFQTQQEDAKATTMDISINRGCR